MTINPDDFKGHDNGPGKFEGEANATKYYHQLMMNGDSESFYADIDVTEDADIDATPFDLFTVDAEEADAFGKDAGLSIGDTVVIYEDNNGFVNMWGFATRAAAEYYINKWRC